MLILLLMSFAVIGAAIYYFLDYKMRGDLEEKERRIVELEDRLMEKQAQLERILESRREAGEKSGEKGELPIVTSDPVDCLSCHDLGLTKAFHIPQTIMKIDERKGLRRRICIDCHGPLGPPWSADQQMTPLEMITFNASVGVNGVFDFPNKVVHHEHKRKLESGAVTCQFCHVRGDDFIIPTAKVNEGQVLVCQNCKAHPEDGNFITIHVELKGKPCTTCHTGGILEVHRKATAKLGQVP
jgi:hypothetical protein